MAEQNKTIGSLIDEIKGHKAVLATKAKGMRLFSETDNPSLAEIATEVNKINVHDCENYTVAMGTQITIAKGYHTGCTITGGAPEDVEATYKLEDVTVDSPVPGGSSVTVSKSSEEFYGIDTVTINPLPGSYKDTSNVNILAKHVLEGKTAVNQSGEFTGTMPNQSTTNITLDATNPSKNIPEGYYSGLTTASVTLETKTVTPTESAQNVTPTSGKVLSKVTVNAIPANYADTSDATIDASKVLSGEVAYGKDTDGNAVKIEGAMPNQGSKTFALDITNNKVTIPEGYYNGLGFASITTEEKSVTPSTAAQNVTPTSGKVLSKVTVAAIPSNFGNTSDATIAAGDVLDGMIAYGKDAEGNAVKVEGTMPNNAAVTATLNTTTTSYTVPAGYHNGSGKVSITLEEKSVTPSTAKQTITPASGKVLSKVTVDRIPLNYADVSSGVTDASSADAAKANILTGNTFVGYNPTTNAPVFLTGTMPNNGALSASMNGTSKTSYTIPAGYTSGGSVTFDDSAIIALLEEI